MYIIKIKFVEAKITDLCLIKYHEEIGHVLNWGTLVAFQFRKFCIPVCLIKPERLTYTKPKF
jgi:hypothetical protein